MTMFLIILLVLTALNITAFLLDSSKTRRDVKSLFRSVYSLSENIRNTQSRLEALNEKEQADVAHLIKKHKQLDELVASIELFCDNLPPASVGDQSQASSTYKIRTRRTYTKEERENAIAYYEQRKAEGITQKQAAETLCIPYYTYKKWFRK